MASPQEITVAGLNFGELGDLAVFVDGASCHVTKKMNGTDFDTATCRLPPGTGFSKGIFMQSGVFFSVH